MPLSVSEQVNVTVVLELFQPAAFGGGLTVAETSGSVLSILRVTDVLALNPALFTAVPITTWYLPSVATGTGEVQEATPRMGSEQLKVTVTLELFQPAAFGA